MMDITCGTCYDTQTIDQGGREIRCPDCPRYHPSSVTIEANPNYVAGSTSIAAAAYQVRDQSQIAGGYIYGKARTMEDAKRIQRKRQGVIKAALTRRANKQTLEVTS